MDVGGASAERLSDFYTAVFADVLRASASASRQLFHGHGAGSSQCARSMESRRSGSRQRSPCFRSICRPGRSSLAIKPSPSGRQQRTTTRPPHGLPDRDGLLRLLKRHSERSEEPAGVRASHQTRSERPKEASPTTRAAGASARTVSPRRRPALLRAVASRTGSRRSAPATAAPHACPAPRSGRPPAPQSGPRAARSRCGER